MGFNSGFKGLNISEANITGLIKRPSSLWTIIGYSVSPFIVDTNSFAIREWPTRNHNNVLSIIIIFNYALQPLRLIVRSGLDVPTFATRVTMQEEPAAEGGTVGEKCPVNFA